MSKKKYDMLLICNRPAMGSNADTIIHHINSFKEFPSFRTFELAIMSEIPEGLELSRFDAVAIHYTIHLSSPSDHFLSKNSMQQIAQFKGLKCVWLHDEYRRVNDVIDKMRDMNIDIIFTLASGPTRNILYPKYKLPNAHVETVYAGYLDKTVLTQKINSLLNRTIDIGYRARRPPFWLGELGQEKIRIGINIKQAAQQRGLRVDISIEEQERLYGKQWNAFLNRCKTVLCVESGASIIDFDGEIEKGVERDLIQNPHLTFEEISVRHLREIDWKFVINPISPRIFEAAAAKTVIVGFEGKYSGLMTPWKHYIPLKKDFSNLKEVFSAIEDTSLLETIADYAYQDLVLEPKHSYFAFAKQCDTIMRKILVKRRCHRSPCLAHYSEREYKQILYKNPRYLYRRYICESKVG